MHQDIREPHYTLPCFLPQWCRIKDALRNIKESTSDTQLLVSALQNAYNLTHHDFLGGCPRDGPEDNLFTGLGKFLEKDLSLEEKVNFQEVVIPCIVDRVMEMETIGPLEGLSICLPQKGETSRTELVLSCLRERPHDPACSTYTEGMEVKGIA